MAFTELMPCKWERVAEIAKCYLVCACSHRVRTFNRLREEN